MVSPINELPVEQSNRIPYGLNTKSVGRIAAAFVLISMLIMLRGPKGWVRGRGRTAGATPGEPVDPRVFWAFCLAMLGAGLFLLHQAVRSKAADRAVVFTDSDVTFPASPSSKTIVTIPFSSLDAVWTEPDARGKPRLCLKTSTASYSILETGLRTCTVQKIHERFVEAKGSPGGNPEKQ